MDAGRRTTSTSVLCFGDGRAVPSTRSEGLPVLNKFNLAMMTSMMLGTMPPTSTGVGIS
jgi:hypothetical protein